MKKNPKLSPNATFAKCLVMSLAVMVAGVFSRPLHADTAWTGANSSDWNDAGNWSNGLPGPANGAITIDQIGINTPTLSTSVSGGWDISIGNGGNTGALVQTSGTLATGNGNWGFIGSDAGSVGTYTLSGDAGFSASRINLGIGSNGTSGGTGTLNINTTGTVDAYGDSSNWWQNNSWQIGSDAGSTGTINLVNGTVHSYDNMWLGAFSGTGILNQSGGTVNVGGNLALARMWNGSSGATVGTATITGGTLNAGSITGAYSGGAGDVSHGTLTVGGSGVVNSEGDLVVAAGGTPDSTGVVNINSGGTVNVATTAKRWLIVNQYDTVQGTVNVNGGTLNLNANTDIRFSTNGNTGASAVNLNSGAINSWSGNQTGNGAGVLDLNYGGGAGANNTFNLNGGTLAISQVITNNDNGTATFNFNGGTLKATGATADFVDLSGAGQTAEVLAGGGIINNNGNNITIGQALLSGVSNDGGLTFNGGGTTILTGANTYVGGTTINNGTTLQITNVAGSASIGTVNINGGTFQVNLGTNPDYNYNPAINLTAANSTFGNAAATSAGQINYTGALNGNGNALNIDNTGPARLYMNGTVSNVSQINVLSGAMGFDLSVGNQGGGAPVNVSNGAALWYASSGASLTNALTFDGGNGINGGGALYYEGGVPVPNAITGNVTLAGGNTGIGSQYGDTVTLNGNITGGGGLTGINGTVVLGGSNTYTGATNVSGGLLEVAGSENGGTSTTVGSSASFDLLSGGSYTFNIGLSGSNNGISGTGNASLDGDFVFNLASADTTLGASWDIVDPALATDTYGSNFAVTNAGATLNGSVWSFSNGGANYQYNETTGQLNVAIVPEPNTIMTFLGGLASLCAFRRMRRRF